MWKKLLTLSLIFAVSVVILIVLSVYAFQRFDGYVQYADAVNKHHLLLTELRKLNLELAEIETSQRSFLLFNDSSYYQKFNEQIPVIRETFGKILPLITKNEEQKERMKRLNYLIKARLDILISGMEVGYPPTDYKRERLHLEKCREIIHQMELTETNSLSEQIVAKQTYETATPQNLRIVFGITMLIFAVSFGLLINEYKNRTRSQQLLEKNMMELSQANAEWEQITHVASHDLQEPLRKIRTFSDILQSRYTDSFDEEGHSLVKRIASAAARAQFLMVDLVNYNAIVFPREALMPVDMKEVIDELVADLQNQLKEKDTTIYTDALPTVKAYHGQLVLLFRCLIENSLKFAKADEPLRISIMMNTVTQKELPFTSPSSFTHYYKIIVEDNGIGFENQFSEKIFKIFQRLHGQDSPFEGRGIGLAMVKRIMTNHMGYVMAKGRPGKGAKFTLYFPVR
jgi:signal transduction histidine kinase